MSPSSFLTQSVPAPSAVCPGVLSSPLTLVQWTNFAVKVAESRHSSPPWCYRGILLRTPLYYVCYSGSRNAMASQILQTLNGLWKILNAKACYSILQYTIKSHCPQKRCHAVGIDGMAVYEVRLGMSVIRIMKFVVAKERRQQWRRPQACLKMVMSVCRKMKSDSVALMADSAAQAL